jgi:predicted TIM-barrel fold metal-dependent hydrolase
VDDLLRPWLESLLAVVPGLEPVDCHTHIGADDPDGYSSQMSDLVAALGRAGARGVVFPMHEPDGYRAANDRVRVHADASGGVLIPFCRVDPHADAAAEAARALDAGARGVKLHPRAEDCRLADPGVVEVCEVAVERRAPLLVHAGRGIPALGRDALALCERFADLNLILAHAGVSDLSWLWRHVPDHPGLMFDTAWWSPTDLLALFALVPPGRIVFGSDAPYGTPVASAVATLRCALQAGLSTDQARSVMGAQMDRLLAGQAPLDAGPALGTSGLRGDVILDRVHTLLATAVRMALHGEWPEQELALARLACDVPEDAAELPVCRSILALLDRAEAVAPDRVGAEPQHAVSHLVVTACTVARTPDVALPHADAAAAAAAADGELAATLPRSVATD